MSKPEPSIEEIAEELIKRYTNYKGEWVMAPQVVRLKIVSALKARDERAAKIAETLYDHKVFDVDSILRAEIAAAIRKG